MERGRAERRILCTNREEGGGRGHSYNNEEGSRGVIDLLHHHAVCEYIMAELGWRTAEESVDTSSVKEFDGLSVVHEPFPERETQTPFQRLLFFHSQTIHPTPLPTCKGVDGLSVVHEPLPEVEPSRQNSEPLLILHIMKFIHKPKPSFHHPEQLPHL